MIAIYRYEGTCTAEVNRFEEYYTKVDIRFIKTRDHSESWFALKEQQYSGSKLYPSTHKYLPRPLERAPHPSHTHPQPGEDRRGVP